MYLGKKKRRDRLWPLYTRIVPNGLNSINVTINLKKIGD
jgi:hypothetical protein